MGQKHTGFTIVELLIVVVVIAILAAITIVSYNGITARASDAAAKSAMETGVKKLELANIDNQSYPLVLTDLSGGAPQVGSDIRVEYNSDGKSYCLTASSLTAKTDYFQTNGGSYASGKCPNHLGYQGASGTYSASSVFAGSSPRTGSVTYNDGGGSLWAGDRFYTSLTNGVRILGVKVWEPVSASGTFLTTPINIRAYTQDWQGSNLGGWNSLPSPDVTTTYNGTRTAGTWTYIWFSSPITILKATSGANGKDMLTVATQYDGSNYAAAGPGAFDGGVVGSTQLSGIYLSEDPGVGRSVSNAYASTTGAIYYDIDILATPL